VSLSTVEHYATTPNPRLAPLPAATRERIARIAADAAGGALAPPLSLLRDPEAGLDHYILLEGQARAHTTKEGTLPAMFVAVPSAGVGSAAKCVAAPKIKLVPREEVEAEADAEGYTEGTRRKRRRRPYREFPAPAFWQPAEGEEDRSAGYFYGWSV
jgi:hypothetical protein